MTTLLTLLLAATPAHAKWFADRCQAVLNSLVADDPSQFNDAPEAWINRQIAQLHVKIVWKKATPKQLRMYTLLQDELARRESFARLGLSHERRIHEETNDH